MSSEITQQHFTPADLCMIERVLDAAGIYDIRTRWHQETRLNAARFLIAAFQRGLASEPAMLSALVENVVVLNLASIASIPSLQGNLAIARWESEGGATEKTIRPTSFHHPFISIQPPARSAIAA